jgi:methylmalonyl-CoA/ethylmalonyl-CoA epimerase
LFRKIDHIAIAVRSLESVMKVYEDALGLSGWRIDEVREQQTRVAVLPIGDSRIELLEATAEDSPVARFIAKRGEGLHHICFQVEDLGEVMEKIRGAGFRLIDQSPRIGAGGCLIAFLHPSNAAGVLIELSQPRELTNTHTTSE